MSFSSRRRPPRDSDQENEVPSFMQPLRRGASDATALQAGGRAQAAAAGSKRSLGGQTNATPAKSSYPAKDGLHTPLPRGARGTPLRSALAATQRAAPSTERRGGAAIPAGPPVPPLNFGPPETSEDSPSAGSVRSSAAFSASDADTEADSGSGDNVKVIVRVRPHARSADTNDELLSQVAYRTLCISSETHPYTFTFDHIAGEAASQQDIFEVAGRPIVENCLEGYNSSIFAYGQTGSGKTHTMTGSIMDLEARGLAPRVFEHLFRRIGEEEDAKGRERLRFNLRVSYLEIYNEAITDLLNPAASNLKIREDIKKGCYVEGLSEDIVLNAADAMALLRRGAENRKIGETRMNTESSRSHSVFTCLVESNERNEGGTNIRFSRLNLIDLAGSERNKSSGAQGVHFNEACHINKSLTTLGRVISELVEAQRRGGRHAHVPYRDSRLTFLLQDSLGGNAKTMIIANVSGAPECAHETLSTLQFAARAKFIRNKARVNEDTSADMAALQREVARLQAELEAARRECADPVLQENEALKAAVAELEGRVAEVTRRWETGAARLRRQQKEAAWTAERLRDAEGDNEALRARLQIATAEAAGAAAAAADAEEAAALASHDLEAQLDEAQAAQLQAERAVFELQQRLADAEAAAAAERTEAAAQLTDARDAAEQQAGTAQQLLEELEACQASLCYLETSQQALQRELADAESRWAGAYAELDGVQAELEAKRTALDSVQAELGAAQADLMSERNTAAAAAGSARQEKAGLSEQLASVTAERDAAIAEGEAITARFSAAVEEHTAQSAALTAERNSVSAERDSLAAQLEEVTQQAAAAAAAHAQEVAQKLSEVGCATDSAAHLEARVAELKAELAGSQRATAEAAEQLGSISNNLAAAEASRGSAVQEVGHLKEALQRAEEQLSTGRQEVQSLRQALQEKQTAAAELSSERDALAAESAARREELAAAAAQLQAVQATAKAAAEAAAAAAEGAEGRLAAGEAAREEAAEQLQHAADELSALRQEAAEAADAAEEAARVRDSRIAELEGQRSGLEAALQETQGALVAERTHLAEAQAALQQSEERIAGLGQELQAAQRGIAETSSHSNQLGEERGRLERELKAALAAAAAAAEEGAKRFAKQEAELCEQAQVLAEAKAQARGHTRQREEDEANIRRLRRDLVDATDEAELRERRHRHQLAEADQALTECRRQCEEATEQLVDEIARSARYKRAFHTIAGTIDSVRTPGAQTPRARASALTTPHTARLRTGFVPPAAAGSLPEQPAGTASASARPCAESDFVLAASPQLHRTRPSTSAAAQLPPASPQMHRSLSSGAGGAQRAGPTLTASDAPGWRPLQLRLPPLSPRVSAMSPRTSGGGSSVAAAVAAAEAAMSSPMRARTPRAVAPIESPRGF